MLELSLTEDRVGNDPIALFREWYGAAENAGLAMPEAMTLATATRTGMPSARMVLLRGCDARGFVFYTNYRSRKGCELTDNPRAALVFHWAKLERQVRVEGTVTLATAAESDAYFVSRPYGSRIGAIVSPQSEVIPDRATLERRWEEAAVAFPEYPPRPEFWGGYRVVPEMIEFWQGRESRLHDRIRFQRNEQGEWTRERLAP